MSTFVTVSCVQWTPEGSAPLDFKPGNLAGFEPYFENCRSPLSSLYIGLTGNKRFEIIGLLNQQAIKSGMVQHVAEVKIRMEHSYTERINGVDDLGSPIDEYDFIKPTASLKAKLMVAWGKCVMATRFDVDLKTQLIMAAVCAKINDSIAISSALLSRALEIMDPDIQHARSIVFPAFPLNCDEWKGNPARLIAFRKETIVGANSTRFASHFA